MWSYTTGDIVCWILAIWKGIVMANGFGIDVGTGNLKIYNKADGTVTSEKNTIAIVDGDRMYAYGDNAYSMYEKAPDTIEVSFPVINGVIADFDNMQSMLLEILEKKIGGRLKGSDIVIAVPNDITEVEKKAFYDLFAKTKTKTRSILLCEKPLADAIGLGLDVTKPTGVMVVDMGADTTEISVISLSGMVISNLLPVGGNRLDECIQTYLRRHFNLLIGSKTANGLKETIGSTDADYEAKEIVVGRDVVSGLPIEMEIESRVVYESIKDELDNLGNSVKMILEKTPPELARDVVNSGIYLTGGGSLLNGIGGFLSDITGIRINIADNGSQSVARGLGEILCEEKYQGFGYTLKTRIFN